MISKIKKNLAKIEDQQRDDVNAIHLKKDQKIKHMKEKAEKQIKGKAKPAKVSKGEVAKHLAALTKEADTEDEVKAAAKETASKAYKMDKYKSNKTKYEIE